MIQNLNLKEIEKKTYFSFHQDGIIDLFVGLSFMLYGIVLLWGNPALIGLCFLPTLLIMPVKKWLTQPRMGIVRFAQNRKKKITKTGIVVLILGILVFLSITLFQKNGSLSSWLDQYFLILFGLIVAIPPFIGAVTLGVSRYYGYGLLILITFSIGNFIRDSFPVLFLILGGIFFGIGLILLVRFLIQYPKPDREV